MKTCCFPTLWPCLPLLAAVLASCSPLPSGGEGTLSLVLSVPGGTTKALSDASAYAYEEAVNQVQLLLFKDGSRYDYLSLDAASVSFPYTKSYTSLGAGAYRIYAVANGPDLSAVRTETALLGTSICLTDCGLSASQGFVMMDGAGVQVDAGSRSEVTLRMLRYASRVRVTSIRNQLPAAYAAGGAMTIKGIFLINALQTWNLGATGSPTGWLNLGGREAGHAASTERQHYIASAAQVPSAFRAHLFLSPSVSLSRSQAYQPSAACLYSLPNGVTQDHPGPEATENTGAPARLVVLAQVNGTDWWYPVTLVHEGKGLERNTTYDVALTFCASGSADPNEPVTESQLVATVSRSGWVDGPSYSEPL